MINRIIATSFRRTASRRSLSWQLASSGTRSANAWPTIAQSFEHGRFFSTDMRAQTAAMAAANAAVATEQKSVAEGTKKAKESSNLFLDNLGKIFLTGIAAVIATLVRSSYNTSNRNEIRDNIEDTASMDPTELGDFREANSELTLDVMRKLLSLYYQDYASTTRLSSSAKSSTLDDTNYPSSSYHDFVLAIRKIMATQFPEYGESFTIQMGHMLDRIVLDILEQRAKKDNIRADANLDSSGELPVALFWTALIAAMNGPIHDRIRILHELLQIEEQQQESKDPTPTVRLTRVRELVGYLQETCQLPPDTQIVPTDQKFPTQQWRRATPDDLVPSELELGDDMKKTIDDDVDLVEFAAILRTRSVCAWGECYMRVKPNASEFEETASLGPSK